MVELMCVIAIISLLASAAWPAIVGVVSGDRLTNNAYELGGLMQQARTTAVSQHTYVWLGFYSYTQDGASSLMVASISGNSGLPTDLQNTNYQISTKPVVLKNVSLATAANYAALPGLDTTYNTDVASQAYTFQLSVPGNSKAQFGEVIVFGPDGQVWLPQTGTGTLQQPVQCVGVGLNAAPSSAKNLHTVAVQVHGLSGEVSVYR